MTARPDNGVTRPAAGAQGGQPHRQRGSASPHPGGQHGVRDHATVL